MRCQVIALVLFSYVPLGAAALEPFNPIVPIAFEENRGQSRGPFTYLITHYGAGFACNALFWPAADNLLRTDPVMVQMAGAPEYCQARFSDPEATWVHYYGGRQKANPILWQRRYKRLNFTSPLVDVEYRAVADGVEAVFLFPRVEALRSFRLLWQPQDFVYVNATSGNRIISSAGEWIVGASHGIVRVIEQRDQRAIAFDVLGVSPDSPVSLTIHMPLPVVTLAGQRGAFDAQGNWYGAGDTRGYSQFDPDAVICMTSATAPTCPDAFVASFDPSAKLRYLVYLMGGSSDAAGPLAVDEGGNIYAGGITFSTDFVTTSGVLQERFAGPFLTRIPRVSTGGDAFVTKLHGLTGGVIYSTYLGLGEPEALSDLHVDVFGRTYMLVASESAEFPYWGEPIVSASAPTCSMALYSPRAICRFLVSLDENARAVRFSKPFSGTSLTLNRRGDAFFNDGSIRGVSADGELIFSLPPPPTLRPVTLAADGEERLWLSGYRDADANPVGFFLGRLEVVAPALDVVNDRVPASHSMQTDGAGNIWMVLPSWLFDATSLPVDFTPTADAPLLQRCTKCDALVQVSPSGAVLFATYLPLTSSAVQVHSTEKIRVFGSDPATLRQVSYRLDRNENPRPLISSIDDSIGPSAQFRAGNVVTLQGAAIGPIESVVLPLDSTGRVASEVQGVRVLVDLRPAPILEANRDRIMIVVPLATPDSGKSTLEIQHNSSTAVSVPVDLGGRGYAILAGPFAPAGTGIRNEDGSVNSADNPAAAGSVIQFFVAAAGPYDQPLVDGTLNHVTLARPLDPPQIRFGMETDAEVLYFAQAPDKPAGIMKVSVRLPLELPADRPVIALPINFFQGGIPHLHWSPHYVQVARATPS